MSSRSIVCVQALRSPMGRFGGTLRDLPVYDLAAQVISQVMKRSGVPAAQVDQIFIGHCRQAGNGPNPGRTAAVMGGMLHETPVTTINMACPSGMQAAALGAAQLALGDARFVLVGGMESMSTMPYLLKGSRWQGMKFGDQKLLDGWSDSRDPLIDMGMGQTAELLHDRFAFSRLEQDDFAALSHQRAHQAWQAGSFDGQIVPIQAGTTTLEKDETIRFPVNREKLASLPSVFKKEGTVSAGNACAMADGAAFLLLTTEDVAQAEGLPILGYMDGFASLGVDPRFMGTGPAEVIPQILKKNKMQIKDLDLFEINEAFAIQVLANQRQLECDPEKVNVYGGAIALGHPTGCSGARLLVTLLHALKTKNKQRGCASLCGAGGVTTAALVRRSP